ncbi:MAG TPA: 16S rRNA (uracil(1498)-N(3))-methyltransferase [Streptosporangiaceae bacterium]
MIPPLFAADAASLAGDAIVLDGAEGRHATTVRRLRPGERADVTDGAGRVAECVVSAAGAGRLELAVVSRRAEPPPDPQVVVVQAIPKGDRGELAVEIMTEVGVDVIVPWQAERCVAQWRGERAARALGRWRSAAREAGKQSRRARFPQIAEPERLPGVAALAGRASLAVVLDPLAGLQAGAVPLPGSGDIILVVGPEGGLSPAEASTLAQAGAVSVRLGPSVLRASSAGAVAAAIVLQRSRRWD